MLRLVACCVLLASCARDAKPIKAERVLLAENTRTLSSHLSKERDSWDPRLRSMSLVIYPSVDDLEEFEYAPNQEVDVLWDTMANHMTYGTGLSRVYSADMDGAKKLENMATTVVSVAELRTDVYRTKVPLLAQASQLADQIKKENRSIKQELRSLSCYYEDSESETGAVECRREQTEDNSLQHKTFRSCRNLKNHRFDSENGGAELLVRGCSQLQSQRDERSVFLERIEHQENLRKTGESILLDLLLAAEKHSGEKVFLVVGASKEQGSEDDEISRLVFDPETSQVQSLTLFLDFGLNYSAGGGSREYSTTNGGITGLRLEKRDWVDILKFTIHTLDFDLHASLSMTVQNLLDMRLVGEVRVVYPDGTGSTGLMSLELDRMGEGE